MEIDRLILGILDRGWERSLDDILPTLKEMGFEIFEQKLTYVELHNTADQAICVYSDGELIEWIQFIALYEEGIVPDTPFNPLEGRINELFEIHNRQLASTLSERRVPFTFNPNSRETGLHSNNEVAYILADYSLVLACKDNADEEGGWLEIRICFP